ncbi:MAG: hypothetical protein OXC00_16740 [Acidimicrobiaceae bacterium]|nr:hypothetical protein [Acidimicrobiaceae bacterium]
MSEWVNEQPRFEGEAVRCPHCEGDYLHLIEVLDRLPWHLADWWGQRLDYLERPHAVLRFSCENCPRVTVIVYANYKGTTYRRWLVDPRPADSDDELNPAPSV